MLVRINLSQAVNIGGKMVQVAASSTGAVTTGGQKLTVVQPSATTSAGHVVTAAGDGPQKQTIVLHQPAVNISHQRTLLKNLCGFIVRPSFRQGAAGGQAAAASGEVPKKDAETAGEEAVSGDKLPWHMPRTCIALV